MAQVHSIFFLHVGLSSSELKALDLASSLKELSTPVLPNLRFQLFRFFLVVYLQDLLNIEYKQLISRSKLSQKFTHGLKSKKNHFNGAKTWVFEEDKENLARHEPKTTITLNRPEISF